MPWTLQVHKAQTGAGHGRIANTPGSQKEGHLLFGVSAAPAWGLSL